MKLSINIVTFGLIAAAIVSAMAQTPTFIPRADLEGSLGTSDKQWGSVYSGNVFIGGEAVTSLIAKANVASLNGVTGAVEIIGGDGISVVATNGNVFVSLDPEGIPAVGTNRVYFQYTGYTNYWTVPAGITNVAIWAWGAGGGNGSAGAVGGAGGFSYVSLPVTNNTLLSLVVGGSGITSVSTGTLNYIEGGWPNGGAGAGRNTTSGAYLGGGGGGMSAVFDGTNVIIVAGGGGGGASNQSGQAGGGGNSGASAGNTSASNYSPGTGGTQTEGGTTVYGIPTITFALPWSAGSYLQGGNGGAGTVSGNYGGGGGGGGYFGGGGGYANQANVARGGGGGSGYVNLDLVTFGYTFRAPTIGGLTTTQIPFVTELPEYISGNAVTLGNGLVVIGY